MGYRVATYREAATIISTYKLRRDRARVLYGRETKEYRRLNSSIRRARNRLISIQGKNNRMRWIISCIKEFNGVDIKKVSTNNHTPEVYISRAIFFKWCVEVEGYSTSDIRAYYPCSKTTILRSRRNFTSKFETVPLYRDRWRTFKLFIKDLQDENTNT